MLQNFVLLTVHHGSILVKTPLYVGDRIDGHLHRMTYTGSRINPYPANMENTVS
jgi:hypothetical protein